MIELIHNPPLLVACFVLTLLGFASRPIAWAVKRRLQPRLDTMVRVGGYTLEQLKVVRTAIVKSRLPEDPNLRDVALIVATQSAQNTPLQLPPVLIRQFGIVLMLSFLELVPFVGAAIQVLMTCLIVAIYFRVAGRLRNIKKLLAEHPEAGLQS